jgi:hypothetical protein
MGTNTSPAMKPLSASLVVLAAAILVASGAHVRHGDTQIFVMGLGCAVGLLGIWGWRATLKEK